MKNKFVLILSVCLVLVFSCQILDKKNTSVNANLSIFSTGNCAALQVYKMDVGAFKVEMDVRLDKIDQSMAVFRLALETAEKSGNSYYKNQIQKLEKGTADLKQKLRNYRLNDEQGWVKFKLDFIATIIQLEGSHNALGVSKHRTAIYK